MTNTEAAVLAEDIAARAHNNTALTARESGWRGDAICWPEYEGTFRANVVSMADDAGGGAELVAAAMTWL